MVDLLLLPFYLFKYVFSICVWLFLASLILDSNWYWNTKEWVKDHYIKLTERWHD